MSRPGYIWRSLTPAQRTELLAARLRQKHPWHSPPHRPNHGHLRFHLTAACYEHAPHIGHSAARLDDFSTALVNVLTAHSRQVYAWCVLPNHYHALVGLPISSSSCVSSAAITDELRTRGTANKTPVAAKCSSVPSSARCVLTATSGPPSTTFTTTRSIMVMSCGGPTGRGVAQALTSRRPDRLTPRVSGMILRSGTTGRAGTIRACKRNIQAPRKRGTPNTDHAWTGRR